MFYRFNKLISMVYSLVLIVVLIALDQFTKVLAVNHLMNKADFILIPGVLQFHYLENTGAAFSILEGKQSLFAISTPILLLVLVYLLFRMPRAKKFVALDYVIVFLIAGAIGNYYCVDGIHPNEKGHRLIRETLAENAGRMFFGLGEGSAIA